MTRTWSKLTPAEVEIVKASGGKYFPDVRAEIKAATGREIGASTLRRYRKMYGVPAASHARFGETNPVWLDREMVPTGQGLMRMRVIENGRAKWRLAQRVLWEREHGPIPKGAKLVCLGDKLDPRPENWRLMTRAEMTSLFTASPIKFNDATAEERETLIALTKVKMALRRIKKGA